MGYRPIERTTIWHEGLPIYLQLQERLEVPPEPFYCLSWRTLYASGTQNRRFYRSREAGFWTVTVPLALELMRQAERHGWLDGRYEDQQVRHRGPGNRIVDSRELEIDVRRHLFESLTCTEGEPDWGNDPIFIVIDTPDEEWRKVMIVDTLRTFCTFRSMTTDTSYRPVIADPHLDPWRMDNAMQDASAAMIRVFMSVLEDERVETD